MVNDVELIATVSGGLLLASLEMLPFGFAIYSPVINDKGELVDFTCIALNATAAQIVQLERSELLNQSLLMSSPIIKEMGIFDTYVKTMQSGEATQFELHLAAPLTHEYEDKWFSVHAQCLTEYLLVSFQDISKQKQLEALIRQKAYSDELTGLYNRHYIFSKAPQLIALAERESWQVGLLYFDLNGFKAINDSYGHAAGDELLKALAQRWQVICRKSDLLFRLGGDEFGLFLSKTNPKDINEVSKRIKEVSKTPIKLKTSSINVGLSIGSYVSKATKLDFQELLNQADKNMYSAKARNLNSS